MAKNLSKKFSMLVCCLMTMQALRLVISTAGFCVVRFHIDCELFNIFISRLVNAVLMSQLFGNWLGDLFVFTLGGKAKLWAAAVAFWFELFCFISALICICHTECGHLTGFYWSMVSAYFWWKVGEAPATSIAVDELDYYFAGFTLSGVWASCLKGLVMRCVAGDGKTLHFHSIPLGDVNVSVVGARSVKTTVDYRAAKWLYIITIFLTFLTCVEWTWIPIAVEERNAYAAGGNNKKTGLTRPSWEKTLGYAVGIVTGAVLSMPGAILGVGVGWVFALCFKCCLPTAKYASLTKWCQLIFGIVGGLLTVGGVTYAIAHSNRVEVEQDQDSTDDKWKDENESGSKAEKWTWVAFFKWGWGEWKTEMTKPEENAFVRLAALEGLVAGMGMGAWLGRRIGLCKGSKKRGTAAGAFFGSFFGLCMGEVVNGSLTWKPKGQGNPIQAEDDERKGLVFCGILIVVAGLGTVYSIYPGMAPCSITQFKYFNIIDILILVLSSSGPLVTMGLDLGEVEWRLLGTIRMDSGKKDTTVSGAKWGWVSVGLILLIATNVCEGIVLSIMQHPFSKTAQKVTNSGWRAVLLTVTMVTSQLVSTGIGFGCIGAGSAFNDGWQNVNSTLVLWTTECCGVLGEGYLTELKKYEPGKWPTQGMGKWDTYWWWNGKAFGNAWQIWCCIGTKDLRRDIMLCRK